MLNPRPTRRWGNGSRWLWVVGTLALGVPVILLAPPLVAVLVVILSVTLTWGDRPPTARRRVRATVFGLFLVGFLYLLIWSHLGVAS